MTDRELMAEAVEIMLSAINSGDWNVDGACYPHAYIIRLKNRLAQPEYVHASDISQERVDETAKRGHEPALWLVQYKDRHEFVWGAKPVFRGGTVLGLKPLYTAPPKREWVGLTDIEREEIVSKKWWDWEDAFDVEGFVRAIEAKLKEKNT